MSHYQMYIVLGETLKHEGSATGIETTTASIEDGLKEIEAILAIGGALPVKNGTTLAETGNSLEATVQHLKNVYFPHILYVNSLFVLHA